MTTSTRTIAVIMPNTQGIRNDNWQQYVTSVDRVEALTGYDFFSNVTDEIEAVIEARVDGQTAPISNGRLAFASDGNGAGNNEIYSVNPDGSDLRRLTDNPASDSSPMFSPDGGKLLFVRNNEIFIMNPDGTNQTQLTSSNGTSGFPVWAPFGNRIAFLRFEGEDAVSDVFVMNPNGSNHVNVTNTPNIDEYYPTFAPDGSRLAYERYDNGSFEIYAANFDGCNLLNLTSSPAFEERPVWSPDGSKIAYERFDYGGSPQVFVMNRDGTSQRQVSSRTWESRRPRWSPDGSQIAYMGYTYDPATRLLSTYDIYLAQTDGSGVRLVRETADGYDYDPLWSPDGTQLAYFQLGGTAPGAGINVTKADGSNLPITVSNGLPVRFFDLTWQAAR